jgi:hypothetical protein
MTGRQEVGGMDEIDEGPALSPDVALAMLMRKELLRLAAVEDELAVTEAARTPYWEACPESVIAHRVAARVLRADADRYLVSNALLRSAS